MARLTTTSIAARAGVSVGTLYQYFPDKHSLVMALKVHYAQGTVGRIATEAQALIGQPLEVAVPLIIQHAIAAKRDSLPLLLALREAVSGPTSDAVMKEANRALLAVLTQILVAAVPGLTNAPLKARVLLSAVEGPLSFAMFENPSLVEDSAFTAELCALALGYVRTFPTRR